MASEKRLEFATPPPKVWDNEKVRNEYGKMDWVKGVHEPILKPKKSPALKGE
jgi:hypothetical protein